MLFDLGTIFKDKKSMDRFIWSFFGTYIVSSSPLIVINFHWFQLISMVWSISGDWRTPLVWKFAVLRLVSPGFRTYIRDRRARDRLCRPSHPEDTGRIIKLPGNPGLSSKARLSYECQAHLRSLVDSMMWSPNHVI